MFRVDSGTEEDLEALLALFDRAVEWLVERGQTGQWGEVPFSANPVMVEYLRAIVGRGELRIALGADGVVVGGYVLGEAPDYAPVEASPSRYLEAMVSDRRLAGRGIGALLVADARERALVAGVEVLRADCWAEAGGLVRWYQGQGFDVGEIVRVGEWPAQLLRMELA